MRIAGEFDLNFLDICSGIAYFYYYWTELVLWWKLVGMELKFSSPPPQSFRNLDFGGQILFLVRNWRENDQEIHNLTQLFFKRIIFERWLVKVLSRFPANAEKHIEHPWAMLIIRLQWQVHCTWVITYTRPAYSTNEDMSSTQNTAHTHTYRHWVLVSWPEGEGLFYTPLYGLIFLIGD